jgi:hypothetical protein
MVFTRTIIPVFGKYLLIPMHHLTCLNHPIYHTCLLLVLSLLTPSAWGNTLDYQLSTGHGPEDLALVTWGGQTALITATARRRDKHTQGQLEIYVPGTTPAAFTPIPCDYPHGWNPLGLTVINQPKGEKPGISQLLYVINQRHQGSHTEGAVEVFSIQGKTLTHLRTIGPSPQLHQANSIAATPDGHLYVSLFRLTSRRGLIPSTQPPVAQGCKTPAKDNLILHLSPQSNNKLSANATPPGGSSGGPTTRFKNTSSPPTGSGWQTVAHSINGANGITLSRDHQTLLCAAYHDRRIFRFTRHPRHGSLSDPQTVLTGLPFHPDNLKTCPNGHYSVAGTRSTLAVGLHILTGSRFPARGGALSFDIRPDGTSYLHHDWQPLLKTDPHAPSTALPMDSYLYIGHIHRPGILQLPLTPVRPSPSPKAHQSSSRRS